MCVWCEGDSSASVGSGEVWLCGTRGSGVLSSTGDMLVISVVRGVGGVCGMCLARGSVNGEGGEWTRELGLDFTNPVGTGSVRYVSVFWLRWVGGLDQGRERWDGVMPV